MNKILLIAEFDDVEDIAQLTKNENIVLNRKPSLNISEDHIVHYLTLGGGFLGLAKCILEYLKLKYQRRSVTIKDQSGKEVIVEGLSVEEVEKLLHSADKIYINKVKDIEAKHSN